MKTKVTDLYEFHKKNVVLTAIDGKTYRGFAVWIDDDEFEKEPESLEIEENVFYLEDIKTISVE